MASRDQDTAERCPEEMQTAEATRGHVPGVVLAVSRIVGVVLGVIVGTWLDERLFTGAPEWTSAITPTLLAILGWAAATFAAHRLGQP